MSVSDRLNLQHDLIGGIIALGFVALFIAALAVRAWNNTNRMQADARMDARLRRAGVTAVREMDPVDAAALRARLVTASAPTPLGDYFAAPEQPIPYALTDKADAAVRVRQAGPFCHRYFFRQGGTR